MLRRGKASEVSVAGLCQGEPELLPSQSLLCGCILEEEKTSAPSKGVNSVLSTCLLKVWVKEEVIYHLLGALDGLPRT